MTYLISKLFWYILLAFAIGLAVGWITCKAPEDNEA